MLDIVDGLELDALGKFAKRIVIVADCPVIMLVTELPLLNSIAGWASAMRTLMPGFALGEDDQREHVRQTIEIELAATSEASIRLSRQFLQVSIPQRLMTQAAIGELLQACVMQVLPHFGRFFTHAAAIGVPRDWLLVTTDSQADMMQALSACRDRGLAVRCRPPCVLSEDWDLIVGVSTRSETSTRCDQQVPLQIPSILGLRPRALLHCQCQETMVAACTIAYRERLLKASSLMSSPLYRVTYLAQLDAFLPPFSKVDCEASLARVIFGAGSLEQYKCIGPADAVADFIAGLLSDGDC